MRTCKRLGISTVAVHSDVDVSAMHVREADEAFALGGATSAESYLRQDKIIEALKLTGADALHPGYGFLSENAAFVERLDEELPHVRFVGPPASAMHSLGDKLLSKALATNAKVNVVSGGGEVKRVEDVEASALAIGFPVMIKASAGGGGKGMRVAWNLEEAVEGYRLSKEEAKSSFGDDRVFIEKFIEDPRHIEFQLVADKHGNTVYLNERECSIQRRNQKVVEEAPSVLLSNVPGLREEMGKQAVALARAAGYFSAGTVEFLVDASNNFYFLEMNTRLQVEHPVTELITGVDLVEQMIRVAEGFELPFSQHDIGIQGWAFESRVYAEDPLNSFLPSIGNLIRYEEPTRDNVRVDAGVEEGSEISMYYDPMISKVITHADTREEALRLANTALDSYVIRGVQHNINFIRSVYDHPRFKSGDISTKFIEQEFSNGYFGYNLTKPQRNCLVATAALTHIAKRRNDEQIDGQLDGYVPESMERLMITVRLPGAEVLTEAEVVLVEESTADKLKLSVSIDGSPQSSISSNYFPGDTLIEVDYEEEQFTLQMYKMRTPLSYGIVHCGTVFDVTVVTPEEHALLRFMPEPVKLDLAKVVVSPMAGSIVSLNAKVGDKVTAGQEVCIVEAMKMQNVLRAGGSGIVKAIHMSVGHSVGSGDIILELEED